MAKLSVQQFLDRADEAAVFDVRTPSEFAHAHIPGAMSLPLFDDDERAEVGTTYKEHGRDQAIRIGLDIVGPKMRALVERAEELAGPPGDSSLLIHCWRGGMRSASVAWLLDFVGWDVEVLDGGYKAFRHWVLDRLEQIPPLRLLGGRTGSAKTRLLAELAEHGESVVDLEGLANHRGSAFGALKRPPQPSQEQFEALLATALSDLEPGGAPVWVEDESRMIGSCKIPDTLMARMRSSPVVVVDADIDTRVALLVEIYGDAPTERLVHSFGQIQKRLGTQRTAQAISALGEGDIEGAARIALDYYDKAYDYGLSRRPEELVFRLEGEATVPKLLHLADQIDAVTERS